MNLKTNVCNVNLIIRYQMLLSAAIVKKVFLEIQKIIVRNAIYYVFLVLVKIIARSVSRIKV